VRLVGSDGSLVGSGVLPVGDLRAFHRPNGPDSAFFDGAGDLVFVNPDGSPLPAIQVPDGVTVFVNNGDSTWSVG
jgi:hypothetical protein